MLLLWRGQGRSDGGLLRVHRGAELRRRWRRAWRCGRGILVIRPLPCRRLSWRRWRWRRRWRENLRWVVDMCPLVAYRRFLAQGTAMRAGSAVETVARAP